ncbi:family 65 glycosyl hydrolase domain-containing protein [Mangrovibacterium marinum]|uniref:Maltose phosphorylase n=1 Tax=Mangrovibacterium marinum TaxID=1639118 RepID=A0A2T5C0L8_9BACT|nr:family 65 glycosyl hydrolase domain-containing protein [Mangrovibacterium marinum]PTN08160.1 maltose phosphorylase [Mangrovibacterium marinum]
MKNYITHSEWQVVEEGFVPNYNRISESLFSIANGHTGQRANFEENYSGDSLQGNYMAGVYYPDKTRVGWWKNGYPEYFAKILNAANWIGLRIRLDGEELDLAKADVADFVRVLDMRTALLTRKFTATMPSGKKIEVVAERFLSIADKEIGAIRYRLKSINFTGALGLCSYIDGDIRNEDSNYDEKFWTETDKFTTENQAFLCMETKKTSFFVCHGVQTHLYVNGAMVNAARHPYQDEKFVANTFELPLVAGDEICIEKYMAVNSSLYQPQDELMDHVKAKLAEAVASGFDKLFEAHSQKWAKRWQTADIMVQGDVAAQQGIRFNIFQLMQTYSGDDERLNIGPKGFTGEKYGGVTYWDTEAYCLPFFMATAPQLIAKNLLLYRHKHLLKAIENAAKLGFTGGAALYPMVTINGEECHNEWEITFEEIHRNGAIAYAIYNYVNYTGDRDYLAPYGFEVLLGISRFWAQRVNWSDDKNAYVMLGVTGPNEYENNVNNNFHTNRMAVWTLKYTMEVIDFVKKEHPYLFSELTRKWAFNEQGETEQWRDIVENMHFPYDSKREIFLQQDGFLDKEIIPAADLDPAERPIHQNWSWDRILRSCYIKQADTLQSFYWFRHDFDQETLRRHFDFYEPITVHESSLSSCIHAILAARIGREEKAYEMYLRTARLDLDDYNNDTEDGLHVTSMGGTWLAFVETFGGLDVKDGQLLLNPFLPKSWEAFAFRINFRGAHLEIRMGSEFKITNHSELAVDVVVWGEQHQLKENGELVLAKKSVVQ